LTDKFPDFGSIRALQDQLARWLVRTPVLRCRSLEERVGGGTEIFAKLEFLQVTGSFKARGALASIAALTPTQLTNGVTAVSAGNHAIATAFAARTFGASAKVVMPSYAEPARLKACRDLGAEIVLANDVHEAFSVAERIRDSEGRCLVHPFEGPAVAMGTGTLGLELCDQVDPFDAVVVPVGGGGLCAGIANAVKQARPDCKIFGVEPTGADSMHRSFAVRRPVRIERVATIADSLGAPYTLPYSFELCRRFVSEIVLVDDNALRAAMGVLYDDLRIAVEPACAASTAAILGPLTNQLRGQRIVLVLCGSNTDWATFERHAFPELTGAA
jgi:threonine dehydratase